MLSKSSQKNYYLLKEVAIQSQIISQLTNLMSTFYRQALSYSTKPNLAKYCVFGHSFCNINHARYNIVRNHYSLDEYWWDNLDCRSLSSFSFRPMKSASLYSPHSQKLRGNVKYQYYYSQSTSQDAENAFQKRMLRRADKLQS